MSAQWSSVNDQLKSLWRVYWDVKDISPKDAEHLKDGIVKITKFIKNLRTENQTLIERNEETERLLIASIKSSHRR